MASICNDRVEQAVKLLREAGCLDLLVGVAGDAGRPTRRVFMGVAAAMQGLGGARYGPKTMRGREGLAPHSQSDTGDGRQYHCRMKA
ncbi:hypothetical protein NDU88_003238 [Pleurodeles waltl]|uniref:Uncharacterized protein n=1 Tax=Pleurodeles waltl TaxID=8319 RepID=A0AAV7QB73_PLEWA|nr:hypothetical protein NDU88_003238 [Pleurodeles waltl]